jgi:hypothetical protein
MTFSRKISVALIFGRREYSRKLNSAQKRYTTGKQELLSIVETLKEFKNILLGQKLIVHTDHKNLLYQKMSTDRIIRWRLLIEEFGPTFLHIKGEKNVIADALSRLDANFNEKLPTEPTNDSMAYIFLTNIDIKETDFPLSPNLIAKYQRLDKELKQSSLCPTREVTSMFYYSCSWVKGRCNGDVVVGLLIIVRLIDNLL